MTSAHESLSHGEAERLLSSLAGIVSAAVVTDSRGRIVEIHILSAAELHPKQVVRNVESALSAGLGIEVDRRIISVAQIRTPAAEAHGGDGRGEADSRGEAATATHQGARNGGGGRTGERGDGSSLEPTNGSHPPVGSTGPVRQATAEAGRQPARLQYVRFEARRDAEMCACTVILRDGDLEYAGTGSGADTAAGRCESAARAVLDAIQQARPELRLQLEGALISASRGRSYVIVTAQAVFDRHTVPLVGAAPLARSPEESGILAALQATNRWSG